MADAMVTQSIDPAYVDEPMFNKPMCRDFIPEGDPDEGLYAAMGAGSKGYRDFIPEGETAAGDADPEPVPDRVNRTPQRRRKGEFKNKPGRKPKTKVAEPEDGQIGHGQGRSQAMNALAAVEASVMQQMLPGKVREG